jgi:hypothetical protein
MTEELPTTKNKFYRLMLAIALFSPALAKAEEAMIHFSLSDQSRWAYFSDQVMGNVSEDQATNEQIDNQSVLHLSGMDSTANQGGFIQARTKQEAPIPAIAQGVILNVHGNDKTYFAHLRTKRTLLPWQIYQASFDLSEAGEQVHIPFADFTPYGRLLGKSFNAESVRSLAFAAFGRDHRADLSVRDVGFY